MVKYGPSADWDWLRKGYETSSVGGMNQSVLAVPCNCTRMLLKYQFPNGISNLLVLLCGCECAMCMKTLQLYRSFEVQNGQSVKTKPLQTPKTWISFTQLLSIHTVTGLFTVQNYPKNIVQWNNLVTN